MKKEYDFSKGKRGVFYHPEADLAIPIYLEAEVVAFLQKVAEKNRIDVGKLVNEWIKKDIALIETFIQ